MDAKNSVALDTDPRSIIGSRLLEAPRELVFSALPIQNTWRDGGVPMDLRRRRIVSIFDQAASGVS